MCFAQVIWLCAYYLQNTERLGERNENEKVRKKKQQETFHCAKEGHKIDAIARNKKASFCVIAADEVIPEEYTTAYQSVIVFGQIRILTDDEEKRVAIEKLAVRYSPDESAKSREEEIDKFWQRLCMLELSIEYITGKEGLALMNGQQA